MPLALEHVARWHNPELMATAPATGPKQAAGARPGTSRWFRRVSERVLLGSIMAVIALVVDRRLRRVFIRKI